MFRSVLKHDLEAGTTEEQRLGPGRVASELVFVPAADSAGEDEGWLMGYVYDAARDASDLVVLDAHGSEAGRWRRCTSRCGCRRASTATGSPTGPSTATGQPADQLPLPGAEPRR